MFCRPINGGLHIQTAQGRRGSGVLVLTGLSAAPDATLTWTETGTHPHSTSRQRLERRHVPAAKCLGSLFEVKIAAQSRLDHAIVNTSSFTEFIDRLSGKGIFVGPSHSSSQDNVGMHGVLAAVWVIVRSCRSYAKTQTTWTPLMR